MMAWEKSDRKKLLYVREKVKFNPNVNLLKFLKC